MIGNPYTLLYTIYYIIHEGRQHERRFDRMEGMLYRSYYPF